ncbi:MAG: hypothetical protein JO072_06035 [Parafilimonas sp.]|nr:hypothetical protein [Parafilimonas sp.]
MAKASKKKDIYFGVSKIELISSSLSVPDKFNLTTGEINENSGFTYSFTATIEIDEELELFFVLFEYEFVYLKSTIFKLKSKTSFKAVDAQNKFTPDALQNENFVLYLVDIAINHARAQQASVTAGTALHDFFIPIVSKSSIRTSLISQDKKRQTLSNTMY